MSLPKPVPVPGRRRALGADAVVALLGWGAVLSLGLFLGGTPHFTARTLWAPVVAMAIAMLVCALCRRPVRQAVGEWGPLVLLIALYMQLEPYTHLRPPADAQLLALDRLLFGETPSEWLLPLRRPWLTEALALAYSSYFLLPLGAAAPAYLPTVQTPEGPRMRHRERFRTILCAHLLALALGFVGYILIPARGPRYFLPAAAPLHGTLGYYEWAVAQWNAMQEVTYDAFPSLHTANAALAVYHAFRHRALYPKLPWLITPPSVLLVLSTLYLRMHYAVDVAAGLLLAAGAAWLAPRLPRAMPALPRPLSNLLTVQILRR
jgi:membrane-associated phospholipid phosphatase